MVLGELVTCVALPTALGKRYQYLFNPPAPNRGLTLARTHNGRGTYFLSA